MLTRDPGLLPSGHPAEIPQLLGAFEVWDYGIPAEIKSLFWLPRSLAPPLSGSPAPLAGKETTSLATSLATASAKGGFHKAQFIELLVSLLP
jgi:hypothetical protein